ncbi:MAG: ATPase, T2SS/T4P/T4SS family [Pseudoclavibacter sp.]|jgi:type IV pilus assembly protein PilB
MRTLIPALLAKGVLPEDAAAQIPSELQGKSDADEWLVKNGFLTPFQYARAVADQAKLRCVDLTRQSVDLMALRRVPASLCRRFNVLPIGFEGPDKALILGMADPSNVRAIDDTALAAKTEVHPVVVAEADLISALNRYYRSDEELTELSDEISEQASPEQSAFALRELELEDSSPVVRFVTLLINQAIHDRASDIHIEPTQNDVLVRYRIDGVLHEEQHAPKSIQNGLISRIKVMSDMDIAEHRIPQDGRMTVHFGARSVDLRVATLPASWGETVVLRILDNDRASLGVAELALSDHNFEMFKQAYSGSYGMVLVTGPTGSGKSTTLYATLNEVARPEVNVITVEDPVEYRMPGINQVQVNAKAGLTFASALRSILRSDPDVLLVGEIRDHETAQIAIEAALTGHLVFATLHTNDAPSAITRLIEMGIEPFLVGSAIRGVMAQRLARRLCPSCRTPIEVSAEEVRRAGMPVPADASTLTLYQANGCARCSHTGYLGRLPLQEVMSITPEIGRLAISGASADQIRDQAVTEGLTLMRLDGWEKAQAGETTLEEVLRVIG